MIDLILLLLLDFYNNLEISPVLHWPDIFFSYFNELYNFMEDVCRCEMLEHAKWRPPTREDHKVLSVAPFNDSRRNIAFLRVVRLMPWSFHTMLLGSPYAQPWLIDAGLIANKFLTRGLHPVGFIELHYFNVAIMEQTGYWTQLQNFYDINTGAKPAYKAIMAATKNLAKDQHEEICIIAEKLLWQQGEWFWEQETTFYAADSERVKQAIATLTKIVKAHLPEGSYIEADFELLERDPWENQQYMKKVKLLEQGKQWTLKSLLFVLSGIGVFLLLISNVISIILVRGNKLKKKEMEEEMLCFPLPPVYLLPAPQKKIKKNKKLLLVKKLKLKKLFTNNNRNKIIRRCFRLNYQRRRINKRIFKRKSKK